MAISETTAARYTAQDPDVRLMLRVQQDDADAFEELMLRYQDRVVSLMTHLVGKRDLAEDLAQEIFMRVYRSRKRYVPGSKFSTWLYTIANNVASNSRRSLARRHEVNLVAQESGEFTGNPLDQAAVAASGLMPTRLLDKAELSQVVQLAVAALNDRQRLAVLLNKFEHLGYEEIAEVMELTPAAVKSLLSRARANLRQVLEPYLEQGTKVNAGEADK
ncbi:RNA polymerase sigma factor [Bythopirellula polymerisocia]|uniref:ECF RNA polymerase sigma-E factor n=1 Tax=Bythopirellula polymerisocia TaxID=2528003 RepID=A0A5C6CZK6_9BACT|nr:sigma-70 family RNA polymerase sigma factor [Bythopirellula polymerisocia]TWU30313.1 ECF RNA polymerase sigma-E factor [Bythopirellula polymerisocia]